jgi:hypothetical protein
METFVVRIFVDETGSSDRLHGVVEHIGTGVREVFEGRGMLLELVDRGLERARERRQGTDEIARKESPV